MRTTLLFILLASFFNLPFSKSQCANFNATAALIYQGCNGNCGMIKVTPVNGLSPYTYQLYRNGIPIVGMTADSAQVCSQGVYSYSITDANNCIVSTNSIHYNQATNSSLSINAPAILCENATSLVSCQVTGTFAPYTYAWSNGDTDSVTTENAGIFSVTVTDINGCDVVARDTILSIPLLDSMLIAASLDPFGFGHCENADSTILDVTLFGGSTITSGVFYGPGVRNGASGLGIAAFHPDSAKIDMGHIGDLEITYVYQTTTGCWDTASFDTRIHALPDLSFVNLPDSLCPAEREFQVLVSNTIPLGSMGQFVSTDTLASNSGTFTIRDASGNLVSNFIQLFDTLYPIEALGYQQLNVSYTYTAPGIFGFCSNTLEDSVLITDCCVWPGDTDNDGVANNFDLLPIGLHYGNTGLSRTLQTIDYTCHASDNWNVSINGLPFVDQKHVDTDGNASINSLDTNAIILNWSQTHLKNIASSNAVVTMYIDTAIMNPGDTVVLDIILNQGISPSSNYGIAFTLNYDPLLVDTNSVFITFDNSWLGTINTDMIAIQKDFYTQGATEIGLTRIDQNAVIGSGTIAQMHFIIKDDVLPKTLSKRLDLSIDNIRLVNDLGVEIPVTGLMSQVLVTDAALGLNNKLKTADNRIYAAPNPTMDYLQIHSPLETIEALSLYTTTGQLLKHSITKGNYNETLSLEALPVGIYILDVKTENSQKMLRIIKK